MPTIESITIDPGAEVDFTTDATTIILGFTSNEWDGNAQYHSVLNSSDGISQAPITLPVDVHVDYCDIANIAVTGPYKLYAGYNSTNNGNTTNVVFSTRPRYWVASSDSSFSSSNWSTTSGGPSGADIPMDQNYVYFDGSGVGNCLLDVSVDILNWHISQDYPGTIIQGAASVVMQDATFTDGAFIPSNSPVTVINNMVLSSSFLWQNPDSTFYALGDVYNEGFVPQVTNTLSLSGSESQTLYCNGGAFPNLYVDKTTSNQVNVLGTSPIYVYGDFMIFDGTFHTNGRDIIQFDSLASSIPATFQLVGFWNGNYDTVDSVHGNNGVWNVSPPLPSYGIGLSSLGCFDFMYDLGGDSYVQFPNTSPTTIKSTGKWSISFDMNVKTAQWVSLFYKSPSVGDVNSSHASFQVRAAGATEIIIYLGESYYSFNSGSLFDTDFNHLEINYDNGTMEVLWNNVVEIPMQAVTPLPDSTDSFFTGLSGFGYQIQNIKIYNTI